MRQEKAEIKVGIAYDGRKQTGRGHYKLSEKVVGPGNSKNTGIQQLRRDIILMKSDSVF